MASAAGLGRPVHARREVVLEVVSPPPERGPEVPERLLACSSGPSVLGERGRRVFVDRVGPDGSRLGFDGNAANERARVRDGYLGPVELVTSSPTSPLGMVGVAQPVGNQPEPGRRVALHAPRDVRIRGAEGSVPLLDVLREPRVADGGVVDPRDDGVDAGPRGGAIVAAGGDDVEELREVLPDPRAAVVLVRDRVHPEFRDEAIGLRGRSGGPQRVERLRERVGPSPDGDPERAIIALLQGANDPFGPFRVLAVADSAHAVLGSTFLDQRLEGRGPRVVRVVLHQVAVNPGVGANERLESTPGRRTFSCASRWWQ